MRDEFFLETFTKHCIMFLRKILDHLKQVKALPCFVGGIIRGTVLKNDSLYNDPWRHRTWRNRLTGHFKWNNTGQSICGRILMIQKFEKLKNPKNSRRRAGDGTLNIWGHELNSFTGKRTHENFEFANIFAWNHFCVGLQLYKIQDFILQNLGI